MNRSRTSWFSNLLQRRKLEPSQLPLGLTEQEVESIQFLRESAHWKHFATVLERLGEQQAAELSSGLDHDKYLFASGAFTALRRVSTLADDLIAAAAHLKEHTNARERKSAERTARHAASFVNTPWFDSWRADATRR